MAPYFRRVIGIAMVLGGLCGAFVAHAADVLAHRHDQHRSYPR